MIICRYESCIDYKRNVNLLGFENDRQLLESLKCAFVKY